MALSAGTIVVTNPDAFEGAGGLIAVDPTSGQQATLTQGGLLVEPSGVAFAADGGIFVSDTAAFGNGGLIAVDPSTGRQTKVVASTVFRRPFGIAVDAGGQVVVAYLEGPALGRVARVSPTTGEHRAVAPDVNFFSPADVAIDAFGNVIVAEPDIAGIESRLHRIDAGVGASLLALGNPPGAVYSAVATEANGNILVLNNPNGPERELLRFHPSTGAVAVLSEGDKFKNHFGVAVEAVGSIIVADRANGVIRVDPVSGTQTIVSSGGSLSGPIGGGPLCVAVR